MSSLQRRARSLALCALLCLTAYGCRPRPSTSRPLPGTAENLERALMPGERVLLLEAPGHPTLQLVRRSGDPAGALAVAVFPPGGSVGVLHIAALVKERLSAALPEVEHRLEAHGIGFLMVRDIMSPQDAAAWMEEVHDAMMAPVSKEDLKRLKALPLLAAAESRAQSLSPFGLCMAELGAEGGSALSEAAKDLKSSGYGAFLEQLRDDTAVASRIGFSALGEQELLDAVEKSHDGKWPAGDPLDDSWAGERQTAVIAAQGSREIRLALRVVDSESALAGARSLRDEGHPLHDRLRALDPHLLTTGVDVTLRPAGACVGLTVAFAQDAKPPSLARVAAAAHLVSQELRATVQESLSQDEETLAILSPEGAQEAAALAAWTAVRSARTGGRPLEILEYRATEQPRVTDKDLSAALLTTAEQWTSRKLPVAVRDESGQAELWMVLASPCGTRPESREESGLRALTVSAMARDFDRTRGVTLEPWVSPAAIGVIAHGPALRGESAARHAERIARVLASSFSGPPLDGRTLAATRNEQIERIGTDPGVELVATILGAGNPSAAQPLGIGKAVATFSTSDAERTRADLVQEPLHLAVLSNGQEAQAGAAQRALERWLAPARGHMTACTPLKPEVVAPGTWTLESIDEEVSAGSIVSVFAPGPPVDGHATAFLLGRQGGYLDRAFSAPGLVAHTEAHWFGDEHAGGLQIRVSAEAVHLEAATHQARAVLAALAERPIPKQDVQAAIARFEQLEIQTARTPRGRLIALFESSRTDSRPSPRPPSAASLRQLHKALNASSHRVVTVSQRK